MRARARQENLLGALALAVSDRLRQESEVAVGHSGAAAAALLTIAQYPGGTVEELRRAIGLSHAAAVRVVDRLADAGLVRRRPGGRGPALALMATPRGRSHARRILEIRRKVLADALPSLSAAEGATITAILERALANLAGDPVFGATICRLCDGACRDEACPVAARQAEAGNVPPRPVSLEADEGSPGRRGRGRYAT
jgi:MarR family transcriptional repressor of emrRAB